MKQEIQRWRAHVHFQEGFAGLCARGRGYFWIVLECQNKRLFVKRFPAQGSQRVEFWQIFSGTNLTIGRRRQRVVVPQAVVMENAVIVESSPGYFGMARIRCMRTRGKQLATDDQRAEERHDYPGGYKPAETQTAHPHYRWHCKRGTHSPFTCSIFPVQRCRNTNILKLILKTIRFNDQRAIDIDQYSHAKILVNSTLSYWLPVPAGPGLASPGISPPASVTGTTG